MSFIISIIWVSDKDIINGFSVLAISESNLTLPLNLYGISLVILKVIILSNCGLALLVDVVGELILVC